MPDEVKPVTEVETNPDNKTENVPEFSLDDYKLEREKLRRENASWRRKLRETEEERDMQADRASQFDNVLSELGVEDNATFDPKNFADEHKSLRDKYTKERLNFAVWKAATEHGGNRDLLLDSSKFQAKAKELDVFSDDFTDQVSSLVSETMEANPAYKTNGSKPVTAPKLGTEIPGGSSEGRFMSDAEMKRLYASGDTAAIAKALSDGRLKLS
jgi:hypothetical protein